MVDFVYGVNRKTSNYIFGNLRKSNFDDFNLNNLYYFIWLHIKIWISCKIKWPKKMTHREISDIMLSDQTKHDWRFQNESLTV